jgi:hypothetical protein
VTTPLSPSRFYVYDASSCVLVDEQPLRGFADPTSARAWVSDMASGLSADRFRVAQGADLCSCDCGHIAHLRS